MRWLALVVSSGCGFAITSQPAPDAALPDAGPRVWILEAEDFTSRLMPGTHQWTEATMLPGFSGASYMYLAGGDGNACVTNVVTCASMSYAISLQDGGEYYVHLRMWSNAASTDSVWVSLDDPTATAITAVDLIQDATFKWTTSPGTYILPAGAHTLTIWHREGGAIVDKLALIQDATPPP